MKIYTYYCFYSVNNAINDIIDYCRNNPDNLDFGDVLEISTRGITSDCSFLSVKINIENWETFNKFCIIAEMLRTYEMED